MTIIYIALGGSLGAVFRYLLQLFVNNNIQTTFPYSTLIVNASGSFLMGLFFGILANKFPENTNLKYFLLTGLLGGFTTFSAFSLDVVKLIEQQHFTPALLYILSSVIISILMLWLGLNSS